MNNHERAAIHTHSNALLVRSPSAPYNGALLPSPPVMEARPVNTYRK